MSAVILGLVVGHCIRCLIVKRRKRKALQQIYDRIDAKIRELKESTGKTYTITLEMGLGKTNEKQSDEGRNQGS